MTEPLSRLIVDVRPGEVLCTSLGVSIELVQKSGQLARLRVTAPRDVKIEKQGTPNNHVASMAM
jgi:sRNA-binding carbon storage regulator CsrA